MSRVALLTPDPADGTYATLWPKVRDRLQQALSSRGITMVPTPWTDHVDSGDALRDFPLVLPLLTWGYHVDHARWLQACDAWARDGIALANPAGVLAWNSDKRYLERLAGRGIAIPPTIWVTRVTAETLEQAFAATGADELIVKPTVSGGAWKTLRVHRGATYDAVLADAPPGDAMLQPYLPTIATEGETSLLYFGERFSHAVNKRPVPGEFRIQEQFGGHYAALPAAPEGARALAEQVLAAIDEPLLYARIDMVPDADGRWLLMEAELIEPDFYLHADPRGGAGFAEAVADALQAIA